MPLARGTKSANRFWANCGAWPCRCGLMNPARRIERTPPGSLPPFRRLRQGRRRAPNHSSGGSPAPRDEPASTVPLWKRGRAGVLVVSTGPARKEAGLRSGRPLGLDELGFLGRAIQGRRRRVAAGDGLGHLVKIARAHEPLVPRGPIAGIGFAFELSLLQGGVGRHAVVAIAASQLEHRQVQGVETRPG